MTLTMGKVTQVSPLLVLLKGEGEATPAEGYAGLTAAVGQQVAVQNVSGRRLIVWAAP